MYRAQNGTFYTIILQSSETNRQFRNYFNFTCKYLHEMQPPSSPTHPSLSLAERINPIFLFDIIYLCHCHIYHIFRSRRLWLKYCEDSLKQQTINQSMNIYICMPVIDSVVSRIFPIKLFFFTSPQTWTAKFYIFLYHTHFRIASYFSARRGSCTLFIIKEWNASSQYYNHLSTKVCYSFSPPKQKLFNLLQF